MRYRYLRSLLRTALAVGLITSGQQHLKAVGLGSLNQPHLGVCFVHDLEWEPFAGSNWKLEDECSLGNSSNQAAQPEVVINTEPAIEDFKQQAEAILDSIQSHTSFWSSRANRCLMPIVQLPSRLDSAISIGSVRMVEWLQVPEVHSVTKIESAIVDDTGINLVEQVAIVSDLQPASPSDHVVAPQDDFANEVEAEWNCSEWDCSDWHSSYQTNVASVFPARDRANTFVFVLDASQPDTQIIPPTVVDVQVGMDPVCPEINSPIDSLCWADVSDKPRVCCPLDQKMLDDAIATSQVVIAEPRAVPPTLESDLASPDSVQVVTSLPLDSNIEPSAATDVGSFETEETHKTVESAESADTIGAADLLGAGRCIVETQHATRHQDAQTELPSTYRDWPMDYATRLVGNELPTGMPNWMDKSICSRGLCDSNPMQQRTSYIGRYTREDLLYANQISAKVFNPAQVDCHTDFKDVEPLLESSETELSPKTSLFGTWVLPFTIAKCIEFSKGATPLFIPNEQNGVETRIHLAKQVRSIGQLLIEFAGRIESNSDRVEFATRDADVR